MSVKTKLPLTLAALALAATPVFAGNGNGKPPKNAGATYVANCPPGLAKKNPPCIPPGQAKKVIPGYHPAYKNGDKILKDYKIIRDYDRYGLNDSYLYYMVGREIFRMSPETGRVIAFIGLADALLR
ncbi:excinuclease ABC subunit A [Shimia sp. W99]